MSTGILQGFASLLGLGGTQPQRPMETANAALFASAPREWIVAGKPLPLAVLRKRTARRYILRLDSAHGIRVTVPPSGTLREAMEFLERNGPWLERRSAQLAAAKPAPAADGATVLLRGQPEVVKNTAAGLHLGPLTLSALPVPPESVGGVIERALRKLAEAELTDRTHTLAARHGCRITRVTVRAQRTRWGSCSSKGVISLNWRLIQTPDLVRDYIILHELMHTRQMNHSDRFWAEVASVCPEWQTAELWLRKNGRALLHS